MKRFKRVYIEITNLCNLKCDFCIGNKRSIKIMSFDEFKVILDKIKPYTNYLYFHILGEPLMHPLINEFIDYAFSLGFYINITTNGYLIDKIKSNNIRQVNISLHSFDDKYGVSIDEYLDKVFSFVDKLSDTYVSLRLWLDSKYSDFILSYINNRYKCRIPFDFFDQFEISDKVFLSQFHEFIWPDLDNNYYCEKGRCYGLIQHIGILSDGSIVPCCLDSYGSLCLGNIFKDDLEDVLESDRVINMINGFKNGYKYEEFCRHCNFLDK